MESTFTYKFRLDGRRKFDDGTYPIKVNIHNVKTNINRDYSFYSRADRLSATKKDFETIWTDRFKRNSFGEITGEKTVLGFRFEIRTALKFASDKFDEVIKDKGLETHQDVIDAFMNFKTSNVKTLKLEEAFNRYADHKEAEGRYKYAKSIRTTLNNFKDYDPSFDSNTPLTAIDLNWLKAYDRTRRKQGLALATIGVYTTNLRTIMNESYSKEEKLLHYPFGRKLYQPPKGKAKNQGLGKEELKKILQFKSDNPYLQEARDYFMFSYFAGGMNLKDIVLLEKNQLDFTRAKTKFTSKTENRIELDLNEYQLEIIERHKGKKHLFNILDGITDEKEIQDTIDASVIRISKQLKKLAKKLEIPFALSYNWARHSFATNVYQEGVDMKAIAEKMGHSNIKTTEGYLDTLVDRNKEKIDDALNLD